jgi:hypothetical protein
MVRGGHIIAKGKAYANNASETAPSSSWWICGFENIRKFLLL